MRTILVTGGAGFIASNFVRYILKKYPDYQLIILDALTYAGCIDNLPRDPRIQFVFGNVRNSQLVGKLMEQCDTVIHYAAESHVTRSIFDNLLFFETDVIGTQVVTNAVLEHKEHIERFIHISTCYDDLTRAFVVGEGFKRYNELKVGDKVLSMNPTLHTVEEKEVTAINSYQYDGNLYHFKTRCIDICVTGNHRMFIETPSQVSWKFRIEDADIAAKRSIFRLIWPKWIGTNTFLSSNTTNVSLEDLCYLIGLYIGDGSCSSKDVQKRKTGLKRQDYLVVARDKVGRFCSLPEYQPTTREYFFPRVFLYIPKTDKSRRRVEEVLTRCGLKWHAEGEITIYFSSHELFPFFDFCGHTASSKHIPTEFLQLSPRYLSHLLQGLLDSDGDGKVQYRTVSENLMAGIVELCTKLGKSLNVRLRYPGKVAIGTRVLKCKPYYDISISSGKRYSGRRYVTRRNIEMVRYHGVVWCPTVQDNGNLLIERNGRIAFCGNSEVYGTALTKIIDEDHPLNPSSPYASAKAGADRLVYSYWYTYGIPAIILRPFNNVGPWQHLEKVIPRFITSCILNEPVNVHGDGKASRDWVYVEDMSKAVDKALHCDLEKVKGEVINIGSGRSIDIGTIAEMVVDMMGKPRSLINYTHDRPGQVFRHTSSTEKAKRLLDWKPETKFEDGLVKTKEWYERNRDWWEKQIWMRSIPIITKDGKKVMH